MDAPRVSFTDDRIDLAHWYPIVSELDVPTPETHKIELYKGENGAPDFDMDQAVEAVEKLGGEAFIRSGYKSAAMNHHGSLINSTHEDEVEHTVNELLSQHLMMGLPTGGNVWFRELLDIDFCAYSRSNLVPEVRVFIRDGEIVCYHPRLEGFDDHPEHKEKAVGYIESAWEREYAEHHPDRVKKESVKTYAERVAETIDGWWSVDFVMDRSGDFWLTDMALDGVYDASERGGKKEGLHTVSEHPEDCENELV